MPPWFILGLGATGVMLLALLRGKKPGEESGESTSSGAGGVGDDPASGDVVAPAPPDFMAPGYSSFDPGAYYNDPGPSSFEPSDESGTTTTTSSGGPWYLGPSPSNPEGDVRNPDTWQRNQPQEAPTIGGGATSGTIGGGSGTSPQKPLLME